MPFHINLSQLVYQQKKSCWDFFWNYIKCICYFEDSFLNLFIYFYYYYYYLAALGLCCCARAFSSCGEWWLLFHCGARASLCSGFSCCRAQALGTRASVVVTHGLNCSVACGIFPDQGSNPCPLYWQAILNQAPLGKSPLRTVDIFYYVESSSL